VTQAELVLQTLLSNGAYSLLSPAAIELTKHKLKGQLILHKGEVPTPESAAPTGIEAQQLQPSGLLRIIGAGNGQPTIIKTFIGTHGLGVVRGDSYASARSIIEGFAVNHIPVMAQEFIQTQISKAGCSDVRLVIVGGKVVAAMRRTSMDDFRANISLSGEGAPYTPSAAEKKMALRAARLLDARCAGVDLIYCAERGPLVLEVNSSPGFGIERVTGVNVAAEIVAATLHGIQKRKKARALLHRQGQVARPRFISSPAH
ncbi:MAG TPA: hypothetical protein VKQ34_00235, partial [Candidatus Saccharimonadales bacterium]|nr:hypothetical protein [Candidatus Saccharimonadales bacterium]